MSEGVLVTGGAGYIGSHVVHRLVEEGWRAVVLDDLSTGIRSFVPDGVPLVEGVVTDRDKVARTIETYGCRVAIHMAGSVNVTESLARPLAYYRNNTSASQHFFETCFECGLDRIVFSSSAAVYGNPETIYVTEETPLNPVSPYGRSKQMSEDMLRDADAAGELTSMTLRYFNVAGADPQGRCGPPPIQSTHLIKTLCETALDGSRAFVIHGGDYPTPDGTCIRDFIHVSDIADIHVAAVRYLMGGGATTVVNCGYGHGYSVHEVAEAFQRILGQKLDITNGPRRSGDIVAMVARTSRLVEMLKWTPKFDDLDVIIESALSWERSCRS